MTRGTIRYGIRLIALAAGPRTPYDGEWVKRYNPRAFGRRGEIVTTANPKLALAFTDREDALKLWMAEAGTRADGMPNRPLTAWTVSVEPLPE